MAAKSEFSFYGDIDFIPTEEYTLEDAEQAIYGFFRDITEAFWFLGIASLVASHSAQLHPEKQKPPASLWDRGHSKLDLVIRITVAISLKFSF